MNTTLKKLEPLRPAVEGAPTGVVVVDAAGTILLANAELERVFGYAAGELVGLPIDVLIPDGLRVEHAGHQGALTQPPAPPPLRVGHDLEGRRKDGSVVQVEVGLRPASQDSDVLVLASIVDVGERHRDAASRHAALEDQLAFERFFAQFSFQCINLPENEVATAIRDVLARLGESLGLERCSFFTITASGSAVDAQFWTGPGVGALELPLDVRTMFPFVFEELRAGRTVAFSDRDDLPNEQDRASFATLGTRSGVYVPLSVDGHLAGAVAFSTLRTPRQWPPQVLHRLKVMSSVFTQVLARIQRQEALRTAHAEVQRLKDQLHAENVYLRREERERLGVTRIVGQSPAVVAVMDQIRQVAATDSTVLLLGETGTGKELFATQIHELSARHSRPMVRVNCGAIPSTLIESELFGREKGAFTGALARQAGRFELADHSTIFLDEIGDLPQEVQVKLLRVLEERTIERLGSPRPITVDTRIIAATHRNLEQRVQEGSFREDLYYRLNVFPIHTPPLRERIEDIPLLVWRFVEEFSKAFGKRVDSIDAGNMAALQQYHWPGNIRELRNTVERALIVATSRRLTIPVPHSTSSAPRRSMKLMDVEREHIRSVLESTRWRIRGIGGAADRLALKPTTLETRMAKLGIRRPKDP